MAGWKPGNQTAEKGTIVDQAVAAWRASEGAGERLSPETRAAIYRESRAAIARPRAHAPLFVPVARLALGAAVPVLVLSLLAGSLLMSPTPTRQGTLVARAPRVEVEKTGGEVVFLIHNGSRTHRISKSSVPAAGEGAQSFTTTTGRFSDRLESDSPIVYYRID